MTTMQPTRRSKSMFLLAATAAALTTFAISTTCSAFQGPLLIVSRTALTTPTQPSSVLLHVSADDNDSSDAQKLLDRAAALRKEIAQAEGKTLEQVQQEAQSKKDLERERIEQANEQKAEAAISENKEAKRTTAGGDYRVQIPNTPDDMVRQAARAIERAFADGIARQTVRFNLVQENQAATEENEWPGGARQIYREAGKPLTDALLRELRAPTKNVNEMVEERRLAPTIKQQDIWDFDGSALHTAEAAEGASADIQALVCANTDSKYLDDISKISDAMGDRLFLLVNPFWRNVNSWSFNMLAPGAKRKAQEVVFDKGYDETYSLLVFQVRGENCVAVKAYPYDWQIFAFREDDYYASEEFAIRLGSCKEEPTSALVTKLLNERPEFRDTRTMRQMKKNLGS